MSWVSMLVLALIFWGNGLVFTKRSHKFAVVGGGSLVKCLPHHHGVSGLSPGQSKDFWREHWPEKSPASTNEILWLTGGCLWSRGTNTSQDIQVRAAETSDAQVDTKQCKEGWITPKNKGPPQGLQTADKRGFSISIWSNIYNYFKKKNIQLFI